jgi:tryptophanyl-tRNA synthetase
MLAYTLNQDFNYPISLLNRRYSESGRIARKKSSSEENQDIHLSDQDVSALMKIFVKINDNLRAKALRYTATQAKETYQHVVGAVDTLLALDEFLTTKEITDQADFDLYMSSKNLISSSIKFIETLRIIADESITVDEGSEDYKKYLSLLVEKGQISERTKSGSSVDELLNGIE